ncbi:MAG: oligosaccharide flippase family protein, partial [bacterium]|nr:oligosaccharide flippase family protein [bacterium]
MLQNKKKNFIWNTIGITFNAFTSLFFLVIVNRINGIEEAGIFSYTYSLACLFYIIALYYNRTYQVADVENEYSNNQYITNRLITSILTLLIVVLFSIISGFSMFKMEILMLILIFRILEAISDCFHGFIQKKDELYYVGQSLFLKAIIGLILFFITDYITNSIILSLILLIITNVIGLIVDIKKYKSLYHQKFTFVLDKSISLFKIAFPVFIFSFLTIYLNNCQKYVMEYILDEKYQTVLGIII